MKRKSLIFAALPLLAMLLTGCVKYNGRSSSNPSRQEMSFALDKSTLSLVEGTTGTISATLDKDAEVNWTIKDDNIATIDVTKGTKVTVSALIPGETTVTATSVFDGTTYSKSCEITVTRKGEGGGGGGGQGGGGETQPVEGETVITYLVIGENGRYKGEKGTDIPSLFLEYTVEFTAKVGDPLPTEDDVTSVVEGSKFKGWQSYEGNGALTQHTVVPNARGKILYASFGGGQGGVPVEPDPEVPSGSVTLYFAGIASWTDATDVHLGINGNFITATKQSDSNYKAVVPVTGQIETVNAYLSQGGTKYFHPSSGVIDNDKMYSTIKTGDVKVEFDGEYTITWNDWHYNSEDWNDAWFHYTFTEGKPSTEPAPTPTPTPTENDVTLYLSFGSETFNNVSRVGMAINGVWKDAVANTTSEGKYKQVFTVAGAVTSVNLYFTENNNSQFRHPTPGSEDWTALEYSTIETGEVQIEAGHSYVVTWTGWDYHYDNWEHAWFTYTFTKIS